MKILAIETATEACSAALFMDGKVLERFELAPRQHTRLILPLVDELLAQAQLTPGQLDAVAFGRGPGSFTGLRIAAGVTQGIAFGSDLPVVPVSTLAAMAWQGLKEKQADYALVALDARMAEVYWGVYRKVSNISTAVDGKETLDIELEAPEIVISPDEAPVPLPDSASALAIGAGWEAYQAQLRRRVKGGQLVAFRPEILPRAGVIARLAVKPIREGNTLPPEQAQPVYLRDRVVTLKNSS